MVYKVKDDVCVPKSLREAFASQRRKVLAAAVVALWRGDGDWDDQGRKRPRRASN